MKHKRTVVFIDAENVRNADEQLGYINLDYLKLISWLKAKKKAMQVYIYVGVEIGDTEKESEYLGLSRQDVIVNIKYVVAYKQKPWNLSATCPKCKHTFARKVYPRDKKKANCDTELTLDVVRLACENTFDEAIIFSGDGDFIKVYEFLVNEKKKSVTVYSVLKRESRITSTKVKNLAKSGMIRLLPLESLVQHNSK